MKRLLITMAIVAFIGTASAVTISALDTNDRTAVTSTSDGDKKNRESSEETGSKTCPASCRHTSAKSNEK